MDRQLAAFQSGLMADCVLECDGKQIPVSKFVLTTHSEVTQYINIIFFQKKGGRLVQ